jgi:hypothetical protein
MTNGSDHFLLVRPAGIRYSSGSYKIYLVPYCMPGLVEKALYERLFHRPQKIKKLVTQMSSEEPPVCGQCDEGIFAGAVVAVGEYKYRRSPTFLSLGAVPTKTK